MLRKNIVIVAASVWVVMGVAGCANKSTKPAAAAPEEKAESATASGAETDKKRFDQIMDDWRKLNSEQATPEEDKKIPIISPP